MITKDKSYFIVDGRYFEKAEQQAKGCEVILLSDLRKQVYAIIEEHGIEVVSIESKTVTVSELEDYKQLFNALTVDPRNTCIFSHDISIFLSSCYSVHRSKTMSIKELR